MASAKLAAGRRLIPMGYSGCGAPAAELTIPLISKGAGAILTDVDGNEYIDLDLDGGTLILGHADPRIVAAVHKAASRGCPSNLPTEHEIRIAELVASRVPSVESVRFVASPHDAWSDACTLARTYTSRDVVIRVRAGEIRCDPSDAHPPVACSASTGAGEVADLLKQLGGSVAAVSASPIDTSKGLTIMEAAVLEEWARAAHDHEALFILDLVDAGFRTAADTAIHETQADLALLGGCLGGGYAMNAVGGRRDVMKRAESPGCPLSRSLPGMPVAAAAAVATLQALGDPQCYETLDNGANLVAEALRTCAADAGFRARVTRVGSILSLSVLRVPMEGEPAPNREAGRQSVGGTSAYAAVHSEMMRQGIWMPADECRPMYLSTAHTEEIVERLVEGIRSAFSAMTDAAGK